MPSTRSQGRAQPTLSFPRRKSCRVSSHPKTPQQEQPPAPSPTKSEPQHLARTLTRIGPLSPRRPDAQQAPPPSSPCLQPRLPLSPRKRTGENLYRAGRRHNTVLRSSAFSKALTLVARCPESNLSSSTLTSCLLSQGDDNSCNLSVGLLGSPPKQGKPSLASPRKLGFDENSPVPARRQLVPSSPRQPRSPTARPSPRRQETPTGSPACQKLPVARLFAESKSSCVSVFRNPQRCCDSLCLGVSL